MLRNSSYLLYLAVLLAISLSVPANSRADVATVHKAPARKCDELLIKYVENGDRLTHMGASHWVASPTAPDLEQLQNDLRWSDLDQQLYFDYPIFHTTERFATGRNRENGRWTYFERTQFDGDPSLLIGRNGFVSGDPSNVTIEILDTVETDKAPTPLESASIAAGRTKQIKAIDEMLDFVLPQYEQRRDWSPEFVAGLRRKAYESANITRYIIVREKATPENPKPRIMATLGVIRAPYRKFQFFHKPTQQWVEYIGEAGLNDAGINKPGVFQAITETGTRILSMEAYMGKNDYRLPRPSVIEEIHQPGTLPPEVARAIAAAGGDLTKPCFTYAGQILEPTKFAIAKDFTARRISSREVLTNLLRGIFTNDTSDHFNLNAQHLYTYNDDAGLPLYRRMGFQAMDESWSRNLDGTHWTTLSLSPYELWKVLKSPLLKGDQLVNSFIFTFQLTLNRIYGVPYDL